MQTKTQTASHHPRLPHDQPRPHPSHHHQACQQTHSHRTSPPRSSRPQPAPPHPTLLRSRPQQTKAPRPLADHSIARHSIARHPVARHSPMTLPPTGLPTATPTVKHQTPHTNPAPHPASPTNHQQPQRAHLMTAQGAQQPATTPAPPQPGRQRFDPQAHEDSRQDSPSPRSPPRSGFRRPRCQIFRLRTRHIITTKNEGFPSLTQCHAHKSARTALPSGPPLGFELVE